MGFFSECMAFFMLSAGAFLTVRTGGFQFTHLFQSVNALFSDRGGKDGVTPFQAAATALGGSVGTANIAGVTGAIAIGGPGTVFWMWAAGLLGMATKLVEILLAIKLGGGAPYCIERGMGRRFRPLACAFALFGTLASFFGTALVQSNTLAQSVFDAASGFGLTVPRETVLLAAGLTSAALTALVIFGGAKRIGSFSERAVPLMAGVYILASLVMLFINRSRLLDALLSIFASAFGIRPIAGAGFLLAMRTGVARGVYSNEAGVGSSPFAHINSTEKDPVREGMTGIFEVFFDTLVICTMTALVLLTSDVRIPFGETNVSGTALMAEAFRPVFGSMAPVFIAILIAVFAFTSLVGWSLYGESCAEYLFGRRSRSFFRTLFVILIPVGALVPIGFAWKAGELFNYLMALPNVIMLFALSGMARNEIMRYKMFEKRLGRHYNIGRKKT